ncbi:NADH-quinone oxidoreductase subunit L [Microaerobacter geothermalis]|uniref:NADH-quinone oxidoreductase subunit L n=1 Tax=Microaerobacter geothermalis TaxID=674972 RepID=UPI001F2812D8|nr:NADH-quinone oxidoreductase subunit L [Microaerobacter geothermalis]MCF6093235.1 NADH-quinone oxidoreductase subunit L [Microaerobacter geothermalis]
MLENAWLIPLFPLLAFILLVAFGRQLKEGASYIGIIAVFGSFVLALFTLIERFGENAENVNRSIEWLTIGDKVINVGFEVNPLNALMLFVVTFVSLLVHIYSKGYMHEDDRVPVFYSYLALFTFSMLGLVISPNLLQIYIFWELVGVCSFLLVGFWYFKPEAKAAAKKAFMVTRIGDVGFFIGIALIFWQVGSLDNSEIFAAVGDGRLSGGMLTLVAILVFIGAIGKSGQFPLHTWLPDAMEGPTPVSALIHAATMVAAGVYLVASVFPLFSASPVALDVVAYTGGITAIFAASIGLVQNDIKRIIAYSTVSQLGYMMLALGAMGYVGGVFHLYTHAFFKALLFLSAGSVIHAVHTQNIQEMGGLWKKMKITGWSFLIGALALSGIFPFAGFWSKDEILVSVWHDGRIGLFWIGVVAAFFTAFYIFRIFFMVFTGEQKGTQVHESPLVMTVPMIILAIMATVAGLINTPFNPILGEWLTNGWTQFGTEEEPVVWIQMVALLISLSGILLAWLMYGKKSVSRDVLVKPFPWAYKVLFHKYYVDEFYGTAFVKPLGVLGRAAFFFDRVIVDGLVQLVAKLTAGIGAWGARLQNGRIQTYGAVALLGLVLLILGLSVAGGYFGI